QPLAGFLDDQAQLLHPLEHGRECNRIGARRLRQQMGEGGLAGARRSPEDQRLELTGGEQVAEDAARTEEVLLPDELLERVRPHALGKRRAAAGRRIGRRRPRKQLGLPWHSRGVYHECSAWHSGVLRGSKAPVEWG